MSGLSQALHAQVYRLLRSSRPLCETRYAIRSQPATEHRYLVCKVSTVSWLNQHWNFGRNEYLGSARWRRDRRSVDLFSTNMANEKQIYRNKCTPYRISVEIQRNGQEATTNDAEQLRMSTQTQQTCQVDPPRGNSIYQLFGYYSVFHQRLLIPPNCVIMASTTKRADFEAIFPSLAQDILAHAKKYNLPANALEWFEKVITPPHRNDITISSGY